MKTQVIKLMLTLLMLLGISSVAKADSVLMKVGSNFFTATLESNATATAFKALCPTTLSMTELNGNEKYHYLETTLPTNASCPGTIQAGDIMLYGNNCIVVFYKTFATAYNYTKIGHINDVTGLTEALGAGNVSVTFKPDYQVVVFSDPHVMHPDLLVNKGSAWTDYLSGQRKLVDYSQPLFDEMVAKIKDDLKPDLVLITGDLTKDGEQLSHNYVVTKLDALRAAGIPTLVIPGNHDRGSNSNAVYYDGGGTTPADVATNDWFATTYANYGYGVASEREGSSLTYSCEPIAGLVVIGIDSGTDGTISNTTLTWVCDKAVAARGKGKKVIVMMHHPLIEHITNSEMLVSIASLTNSDDVRNALVDAGVKVVFSGHFHTSDIAKDYNDAITKEIFDVNTGSLDSYPCDYRVVTLNDDMSQMGIATFHITSLTGKPEFTSAYAQTRLHASVKKIVKAKAEAKAGALAPYMTTQIDNISTNVADAYIIHAEGNEAEVNTDEIFTNLAAAFTLMSGTEDMCNSMLKDLAPYGVAGRENKTNDLSLAINLPASLKLASDGWSTYCSTQKLDISQTSGLNAYIVSSISATSVVLSPVTVIPAETGFIINGTGDAVVDLIVTDADADDVSSNKLFGTLVPTPAPSNSFALSTRGGVTGFYPISTSISIPAHRAYLVTAAAARALTIEFGNEGTTSILPSSIIPQLSDTYTLQGVKVNRSSRGLYITNGKKVIVK